jgi:hypothetical protein
MKFLNFISGVVGLAGLLLSGCSSAPPPPHVAYPAAYQIEIGNTRALTAYKQQSPDVTAAQQAEVVPAVPLYYRVVSPVATTVFVYQDNPDASRTLIAEMYGTSFNSTVTPDTGSVEFAFAVAQPTHGATLHLAFSDRPLPIAPATKAAAPSSRMAMQ